MSIERVAFDSPEASVLRAELEAEHLRLYGADTEPGAKPSAGDTPVCLVARAGGTAVGCGALRPAGPGVVELKRMYVRPAARGRGVAKALLAALEQEAAALGAERIVLETGDAQLEAVAMYEAAGYRRLPCPAGQPRSICFEKNTRS